MKDLLDSAPAGKPGEDNSQRAARPTLFVPAWVDDAELTAAQFRVLCRIARRGDCIESVPNIAKGCHLHSDTVESVVRFLLSRGFITKEARPGRTSVLRVALNPPPAAQPTRNEYPPETEGQVSDSGDTSPKRRATHPPETEGDEGSPLKGILVKETRAPARGGDDLSNLKIPGSLNTVQFLGKWGDWMKHRRGLRKVKEWRTLFQEQLDWLAQFDELVATEILANSIRNGWQGLFEPRGKTKEKRNGNHTRHPSSW